MNYFNMFNSRVNLSNITKNPMDRVSNSVKEAIESNSYCIDIHTHLFDIKCINKSYFIIRLLKDFLHLKSENKINTKTNLQDAYNEIGVYDDLWEQEFKLFLTSSQENLVNTKTKGFMDILQAIKFLGFEKMEQVYNDYIENYALNKITQTENIIITALMMDLEMGWNVKIKKNIHEQVLELKRLSQNRPILPFLACDPRRADLEPEKENLYSLFNTAFSNEGNSFFGVKIYPALGYDPSDYRLWPIYEMCEKFKIPVLSHCGGESISTDIIDNLIIYEGENKVEISGNSREDIAYSLNNPQRWSIALQKFPNLKLNLAHFGGYETWETPSPTVHNGQRRKETIFDFMSKYKHVYADFSYNLVETKQSKNLREVIATKEFIRKKTLFGTDYWVVNKEGELLKEQTDFLKIIDQNVDSLSLSKDLTIYNPYEYLFA